MDTEPRFTSCGPNVCRYPAVLLVVRSGLGNVNPGMYGCLQIAQKLTPAARKILDGPLVNHCPRHRRLHVSQRGRFRYYHTLALAL